MGNPTSAPVETARLVSLDAYRGFIMLAMVSSGFGFATVARDMPNSPVWQFLGYQFDHVPWVGCAFWDLIQPSFIFMVGVAMPYSHASRVNKGYTTSQIAGHTIYRALLLVFLGVFLASTGSKQTQFIFTNVLAQIGLGYAFIYLLIGRGLLVQMIALVVILGGYWLFFFLHPLPGAGFDYWRVGIDPAQWQWDDIGAHWNKSTNAAAAFDSWFLNLFPQPVRASQDFVTQMGVVAPPPYGPLSSLAFMQYPPEVSHTYFFNSGGYTTLNFVPSMGTMLLGLMAGEMLRSPEYIMREKLLRLVFAGIICGMTGYALGETVCPLVKRIWTPSWTLYSAGWTFGMLAMFYLIIDMFEYKKWALPMVIVGMNSIAVYLMAQMLKPWVSETLRRHLGQGLFQGTWFGHEVFLPVFAPIAQATAFLLVLWAVSVWMYKQKIFIRI